MDEVIELKDGIFDFHCHFRQGPIMKRVAPLMYESGVRVALAMPNLEPPIKTTAQALEYKWSLEEEEPRIKYLMTLYLTESLEGEEISKAANKGITGAKLYPSGVTMNSNSGVKDIRRLWPIFRELEYKGIVLNIHGESTHEVRKQPNGIKGNVSKETTPFTAEKDFLPIFEQICANFPRLKIVLEHCSTKDAVEMVKSFGNNVSATITLHHLHIIYPDWFGVAYGLNYCKPVAKLPSDRKCLQETVLEGNSKFFLGSDSAPHPLAKKMGSGTVPPGIYTGAYMAEYAAYVLERFGALDQLDNFVRKYGSEFYKISYDKVEPVILRREYHRICHNIYYTDEKGIENSIVPFMYGDTISWKIVHPQKC